MHLGGVKSYLDEKKIQSFTEIDFESQAFKSSKNQKKNDDYLKQRKKGSIENKIKKLENKIDKFEKMIKNIDIELEINYEKTIQSNDFFEKYNMKKKQLQDLIDQWEREQNKLNSF